MPSKRRATRPDEGRGVGAYLKEAFLFRWNLLGFLGGAVAALLSPIPAVLLPLLGAAELVYLTGLVSIPKFRSAVDRKLHAKRRVAETTGRVGSSPEDALRELLARLSPTARERFDGLRARCLEMRTIARGVGGRSTDQGVADELASPGLDRLLWVFLRLLVSQRSLERFLDTTDEAQIHDQIEEARRRLEEAESEGRERIVRSLRDSLATSELRLENYGKADRNGEFVSLELDRIERKIQALSEMSVNRQDPDFISREVDSVAATITETEAAMNELQLVTGLMEDLGEAPVILATDLEAGS